MGAFIFDIDNLEPCIKMIKQLVSGVEFEEAIIRFINYFPEYETLVAQAENYSNPSFIDSITNDICDSEGRTVCISHDPVNNKIIRDVKCFCYMFTRAIIIPAIETIQNEHIFSYEIIYKIVKDSSFIPERHEFIFAKGLYHFLKFEIMEAVFLLAPQIENSLRYILKNAGVNTDVIRPDKIEQSKIDIKEIIELCSSNNLLSKTHLFYLEKILINPSFSLRHDIAHGKAEDSIEKSSHSFVLCFLVFHLIMIRKIEDYNENNPQFKKLKSVIANLNKYKEIIDIFMKENKSLFKENACEISFMSSLGNILSKEFPYFDVDVIEDNQNLDIKYNLIIHKRINQDNNMFVCRAKKSNSNENDMNIDKDRIKQMTSKEGKYHYKMGCFIFINIENETLASFWYENGKEIFVLEHKNI
jgi:hypothetical protein